MIISFSLRRPGPPAIARTHSAGAASRVLGSGLYTGGTSTYARRAADASPVTGSARPARGGGGGRHLATVTPILDLPLGGWGELGFNWRLFWGTQDAMLWKITDNVKYEEDCEVSWARAQPGPARVQSRRRGPLDRGRGRGRRSSKQAPAAAVQWDGVHFSGHPLVRFSGAPLLSQAFFKRSSLGNGAWKENGRSHTPNLPVCFMRSKSALLRVFSEERRVYNPSLDVAFTHEIFVQRGQTRRPAGNSFCGVSS